MLNEIIKTFLLAILPIGELRAAIPVAITVYHLSWPLAFLAGVLGNLAPIVLLFLYFERVWQWLSAHSKIFAKFFSALFERTRKKAEKIKNKKYLYFALTLFVAIPLPLTGAWSGFLIAFLLGLPIKKSFASIASGIILAGVIITLATQTGVAINNYLGWQFLILVIIVIFSLIIFSKQKKRKLKIRN